jgi:hypothetical protein
MTTENNKDLRNVLPTLTAQEDHLLSILDQTDFDRLIALKSELIDTWNKKQIFRTETEMRVSVLNDGKFPTAAAKYWQCVREQNVFFENLMQLSFSYRKNEVEIKKLQKKLQDETDELERELIQIEIEEKVYGRAGMELVAKDRVREIDQWSRLKAELDTGAFDTQDVNTHQMESLRMALENRAASLTPGSSQAEVINVLGPLNTVNRIKKQQLQSLATGQPNSALLEDSKIDLDGINLKINTGSVSVD